MNPSRLFLLPLMACSPYASDPQCIQVDVVPQGSELIADGQSTMLVDIAVCTCGSQSLCQTEQLMPGTSVELHTSLGQLAPEAMNLATGKGSVTLSNATKDLGMANITVTASDWIGSAQVNFTEQNITPAEINLSSMNNSLMADGHSSTLLQVDASNVTANDTVRILPEGQSIFPSNSGFHNGVAQFIYTAPSAESIGISDGDSQDVTLYAVINDSHFSSPITLTLSSQFEETPFSIVPNTPWMTIGSSLQFNVNGLSGTSQWNSDSTVDLSCNGGDLSSCDGLNSAGITLNNIDCLDPSNCQFMLWVTDSETGEQVMATVTVR